MDNSQGSRDSIWQDNDSNGMQKYVLIERALRITHDAWCIIDASSRGLIYYVVGVDIVDKNIAWVEVTHKWRQRPLDYLAWV